MSLFRERFMPIDFEKIGGKTFLWRGEKAEHVKGGHPVSMDLLAQSRN